MFWERFYSLCLEEGTRPNPVAKELGISSSSVTYWKKGSAPSKHYLAMIANRFGVSEEWLLGYTDDRHPPAPPGKEKTPAPGGAGDIKERTVVTLGRDGKRRVFHYSEEQYAMMVKLLEQLSDEEEIPDYL